MNKKTVFFLLLFLVLLIIFFSQPSNMSSTDNTTDNTVTTDTVVIMETNLGNIELQIFTGTMPLTGGNFIKLVKQGFYDGIIFHRVIPGFMIQGGDPTGTGMGGPGYKIADEFTKTNRNLKGTISMANAGPNTGGSQFFINVEDNNFLDSKHPVFGKVTKGYEIVEAISQVERDESDKPLEDVIMVKVYIP